MLSQLSYTPICRPFRPSKLNNIITGSAPRLPTNHRILDPVVADLLLRKEVIHPHVLVGMPCYDFPPFAYPPFGSALRAFRLLTSGLTDSHGVTGGVYNTRERIHRGMLIRDY